VRIQFQNVPESSIVKYGCGPRSSAFEDAWPLKIVRIPGSITPTQNRHTSSPIMVASSPTLPLDLSSRLASATGSKLSAFRRTASSLVLDNAEMVECKQGSHSVWNIKYQVIWVTKYWYKVLRGEIALRTRDLLRQICQGREVVIVQGSVSPDQVHILVTVPPQLDPAKLVQYMKGKSSRMLQDEFS
jgi:putative transposase